MLEGSLAFVLFFIGGTFSVFGISFGELSLEHFLVVSICFLNLEGFSAMILMLERRSCRFLAPESYVCAPRTTKELFYVCMALQAR